MVSNIRINRVRYQWSSRESSKKCLQSGCLLRFVTDGSFTTCHGSSRSDAIIKFSMINVKLLVRIRICDEQVQDKRAGCLQLQALPVVLLNEANARYKIEDMHKVSLQKSFAILN